MLIVAATARTDGQTRTVTATEARVHFGEMLRIVRDQGGTVIVERGGEPQAAIISIEDLRELQRHKPQPMENNWAERMTEVHRRIAEKWQGPGLTAEEVDDMINYGQR